jgi:hypothetical protein
MTLWFVNKGSIASFTHHSDTALSLSLFVAYCTPIYDSIMEFGKEQISCNVVINDPHQNKGKAQIYKSLQKEFRSFESSEF